MNSSAALIRNLVAAADRGELQYVALFSNSINTKKVVEATAQALKDVSRPTSSQIIESSHGEAALRDVTTKILMGVVWSTAASLEKSARFPELASMDCTCTTNKEGRPFLRVTGLDGDGKIFTRANGLLWDQSEDAFNFVLQTALPRLWGKSVCDATSLIMTDGDPQEITAVKVAMMSHFENATRKRCLWHLVHQEFLKMFGTGELDEDTNKIIWAGSIALHSTSRHLLNYYSRLRLMHC